MKTFKYEGFTFTYNPKDLYGIFVGAGISCNSGIPLVSWIVNRIVDKLPFTPSDKLLFLNQKFPFEAFVQRIKATISIDEILEFFKLGEPNHAHKIIARLAQMGIVKTIVTTNFDTLVEQALETEGVKFRKIYKYEELVKFKKGLSSVILAKIHGSIEDYPSLGVFLERITTNRNLLSVRNILEKLFITGNHNHVAILGYSCADVFDIVPEIEKLSFSTKKIYFIKHHDKSPNTIECFDKYKKYQVIQTDTDDLIVALGRKIIEPKFQKSESKSQEWPDIIDDWATKMLLIDSRLNAIILCGSLMAFIGYYNKALKYYRLASDVALDKSLSSKLGRIAVYSAQVYRQLGNYHEAHKCLLDALKYWKVAKEKINYVRTISDISSIYRLQHKFEQAIYMQKQALRYFKRIKNSKEVSDCLIILGNCYLSLEEYNKALRYYQQTERLYVENLGAPSKAILFNSIAAVFIKLNKLPESYDYLKKAEVLSLKLHVPRITSAVMGNWGFYYEKKGDVRSAIKKFGLAINGARNDADQSMTILKNRADLFEREGKFEKALHDVNSWLEIAKQIPTLKKEVKSLSLRKKRLFKLI